MRNWNELSADEKARAIRLIRDAQQRVETNDDPELESMNEADSALLGAAAGELENPTWEEGELSPDGVKW